MYDYGYDYGNAADSMVGMATAMAGLGAAISIFSLIIGLISIISYAKIFKKAGKPWWASIVPIYNTIVMIEIAELPMWYIALFFIPIANIYAIFKINIEIAKKFGKSTGFGIGMTLVSIIFIPLLAFSDNNYKEMEEPKENTNQQFDATNVINNNIANEVNNNVINEVPVAPIEIDNSIENTTLNTNSEMVVQNIQPEINNPVEPVNVNNFEPVVETVNPVEPTIEVAQSVNAFNTEPVVETVNPVEMNTQIDTLNVEPTIAPLDIEPQVNVVGDTTKRCKNCGNELPDIVSICPNCGTDNE